MSRLSNTYLILFSSVVFFAAAVLAPIFLYRSINNSLSYVSQVRGDLAEEGVKEKQARLTKQQALTTLDDRKEIESLSINTDDAAGFIAEVESNARLAQVELEIGAVDIRGEAATSFKTLSMETSVEGSQAAVLQFLRLIETLPEASMVSDVTLEKLEKTWALRAQVHTPIKI